MIETFKVKGMHCASCASAVERILKKQEGVQDASVNLLSEQVSITSDAYLQDIRVMQQALEKAGFELERIQESSEMTMHVSGMHCAACSAAVERILKKQPNVTDAQVNLLSEQVRVCYLGSPDVAHWEEAVSKGGYHLEEKQPADDAGGPLSYRRHALRLPAAHASAYCHAWTACRRRA